MDHMDSTTKNLENLEESLVVYHAVGKFVLTKLASISLNRVYLVTDQSHPLEGRGGFGTYATNKLF